ncbi:MAG: hypothetical protein ACOC3D_12270 [Pseudomonadota bacterium]
MSKVPISPWFRARWGTGGNSGCADCDGCGPRPTPPPEHAQDVFFLPDEPLASADLVALAPLPVMVATLRARH